jgi:hypothetical protein
MRLERMGLPLGYLYQVISEHTLELNTGRLRTYFSHIYFL